MCDSFYIPGILNVIVLFVVDTQNKQIRNSGTKDPMFNIGSDSFITVVSYLVFHEMSGSSRNF